VLAVFIVGLVILLAASALSRTPSLPDFDVAVVRTCYTGTDALANLDEGRVRRTTGYALQSTLEKKASEGYRLIGVVPYPNARDEMWTFLLFQR
tara:strand:+ start:832 stop:1113 length:282 start_codon:yes stop_codon:yes gene_type:complete